MHRKIRHWEKYAWSWEARVGNAQVKWDTDFRAVGKTFWSGLREISIITAANFWTFH